MTDVAGRTPAATLVLPIQNTCCAVLSGLQSGMRIEEITEHSGADVEPRKTPPDMGLPSEMKTSKKKSGAFAPQSVSFFVCHGMSKNSWTGRSHQRHRVRPCRLNDCWQASPGGVGVPSIAAELTVGPSKAMGISANS
eukprot:s3347_g20.t1